MVPFGFEVNLDMPAGITDNCSDFLSSCQLNASLIFRSYDAAKESMMIKVILYQKRQTLLWDSISIWCEKLLYNGFGSVEGRPPGKSVSELYCVYQI